MTLRRLLVLVQALPPNALTWQQLADEEKASHKPTVEQLRERQAHYDRMKTEGGDGG